jgi:hypothetical protein
MAEVIGSATNTGGGSTNIGIGGGALGIEVLALLALLVAVAAVVRTPAERGGRPAAPPRSGRTD